VVPVLDEGQSLGDEFLAECQGFDTQLRQFDVGVLRSALADAEGRRLAEQLQEVRVRFAAAMGRQQHRIDGHLRDLARSKTLLRGYAEAAERQRSGALYVDTAL
jgi:ribosomal protein L29